VIVFFPVMQATNSSPSILWPASVSNPWYLPDLLRARRERPRSDRPLDFRYGSNCEIPLAELALP
jgi:hypothetical protein